MHPKTQENCDAILSRFYNFYDAVIRSILLQYSEEGTQTVEIQLSTRDSLAEENEGWVTVRVILRKVEMLGVREGVKTPIQVLSQGLHVLMSENRVGLEFGGALDLPDSFGSLLSSDGYAIGQDIEFDVQRY